MKNQKIKTFNVKVIPTKSSNLSWAHALINTDKEDYLTNINKNYCTSLGLEVFGEYKIEALVTKVNGYINLSEVKVLGQYEPTKKVHTILKRS